MAQIAGSRSEFMTSDLGLNDIEYKRKGGCFLSHQKLAALMVVFIVGVIAAGVIGAYVSSWKTDRTATDMVALPEEDEVNGLGTLGKFSSSLSILPTLYTIQLTPVLEGSTVKKFEGRVIVRFTHNGTEPLHELVLNAKGITVSKSKLFSLDDGGPRNVHSRRRREETAEESSGGSNSSDTANSDLGVMNVPQVTANDVVATANSSSDDIASDVALIDAHNDTASNSSNDNVSTDDLLTLPSTPADVVTLESEVPSDKTDTVSTASGDQPIVVQKISPVVPGSPISPDTPIHSTEISIANDETDAVDGFYVIYPDTPIHGGDYSVEITYEAEVDGLNTFENVYQLEGQTRWLLASTLKPLGPRTLFPGFNDPDSKARFSMSIARPKAMIALANMPLQSSDSASDDWVMDHFEKSPPLSSHSLAFMVGDLQPIQETTMGETKIPLTLWGTSNKLNETYFVAEKMGTVTRNLDQFLSTPYTLPKLDVVGLPGLVADGMGSVGLISIREPLLYLTEESSPITKELAIRNLVKLIAEQWLGGLVSAKTRSDVWIFEGSLIYLEHLLADKIDPTLDSLNSFGLIQHDALHTDSHEGSKSLDSKVASASLETFYAQNSYKKGACLIRMLHNVISDSGFRNGYKKFLSGRVNASRGVSDFWDSMSDEAKWLPDGVSLAKVMTSWVVQPGFPIVTVTRNYETGSAVVRQEKFTHENLTSSKDQSWYIPLSYLNDGDDWSSPRKSWLKKEEEEVTLEDVGKKEDKKWVLFNVNQTGYYRVNYDLDNWNLLSSALNSTTEKFPVATRTSLVDDALSLARGGSLGYPAALNLIRYLKEKETHHSPWTVALQNMIELNNLIQNTPAYPSFQEFMMKFIDPVFKKATAASGDSQLKLMAIKWACLVDNPECRTYLKNLSSVPTYLDVTRECTFAKFGGKSEFESLLSKISKAQDRGTKLGLLAALPCFRVEWILQSLLTDIIEGEKFDGPETLVLLKSFGENPMAARTAFQFSRRRWNGVFDRFSKSYPIFKAFLVASINGVTDDQDLKDFQLFKEEYSDKLKCMGHTTAVAEAEARSRISWLKTNLLPVQDWLNDYIRAIS